MLHLLSNYKWTGPADPAVALAARLCDQDVDARLRCSGYTKGTPANPVAEQARRLGLEPVTDLRLSKHRAPWRDWPDAVRLRLRVRSEGIDLVHCHLAGDTRIAARALRGSGVPWVRSLYDAEPGALAAGELARLRRARRIFVFSARMAQGLAGRGLPPERIERLEGAVDLARFEPGPATARAELGFGPEDFLAGIVARVQPQRRFDLLLDAAERAAREIPRLRVLVIGRGSRLDAVAREPARRRGLLDAVVSFPGYFEGDAYPALLRALDVSLFLVPGSDGSARAVREAMACGLPVLASPRAPLPELVRDGATGRILDETPERFAEALVTLWRDPERRRRMGEAARRDACTRFDPARQAERVARAYGAVLAEAT